MAESDGAVVMPIAAPPGATAGEGADVLLARARRGDERAFAALLRLHQDRVYDLLVRMLGDKAEAEDVTQEVFLAFHRALPRFRGESRVSTWLFRIAKNHCLNRIKYLGRRGASRQVPLEDADDPAAAEGPERPDRTLERRRTDERVQAAIAALPEEQRLVVVLREIEGLSYEEIAEVLEQPEGTVKSRLHRARLALARSLAAPAEEKAP
ncbi:sigma-70 family RNA polymerase sigma factor [Vulgatibacter sp.]|uniref:sigma-70 family RNA polymerase sigma factor n=1 Tax=Vulgatibacter sp. TaxID=1971226 RepID=UPI0035680746